MKVNIKNCGETPGGHRDRLPASRAQQTRPGHEEEEEERKGKRKDERGRRWFYVHAKPLSRCRPRDVEGAGKCPIASTEESRGRHIPIEVLVGVTRRLALRAATA